MTDYMVRCLNTIFSKHCKTEPNGQLSIISIFSDGSIIAPEMPVQIPLCLICFLELSVEEYKKKPEHLEARILINAPWGLNMGDTRQNIPFIQVTNEMARANLVIEYGQIEFFEFGKYEFQIFVNNELLYTSYLDLVKGEL